MLFGGVWDDPCHDLTFLRGVLTALLDFITIISACVAHAHPLSDFTAAAHLFDVPPLASSCMPDAFGKKKRREDTRLVMASHDFLSQRQSSAATPFSLPN